jgi:hypothetical protein
MHGSSENPFVDPHSSLSHRRDVVREGFTGVCAPNDLLEQTRRDELSLPAISVVLRRWALQQEDVETVAVGYVGARYSIAILFTELQVERIASLYTELDHVFGKFGDCVPLLYPLGPTQRDSLLLNSADCYVVYPT